MGRYKSAWWTFGRYDEPIELQRDRKGRLFSDGTDRTDQLIGLFGRDRVDEIVDEMKPSGWFSWF
jgi:hypothetical protein